MQTHDDDSHKPEFLQILKARADRAREQGDGTIAYGQPDEHPLAEWQDGVMYYRHLPDDPQGISRVSIGGVRGEFLYCSFRGDPTECGKLLKRALSGLYKNG